MACVLYIIYITYMYNYTSLCIYSESTIYSSMVAVSCPSSLNQPKMTLQ